MENSKSDFRKQCLERLKKENKKPNRLTDKKLSKEILDIIYSKQYKNILLFIPFAIEVDIRYVLAKLKKNNRFKLFVPYIKANEMTVSLYRYPLRKNRFGIYEPPKSNSKVKINLCVAPVVGFDASYRRVGFGKGFYDRFYAKQKKIPYTIFLQRIVCKSKTIVSSAYDIKADIVVAKKGKI